MKRYRAIESCQYPDCRCLDRAGIILYDGPDIRAACDAADIPRHGYVGHVELLIGEDWIVIYT